MRWKTLGSITLVAGLVCACSDSSHLTFDDEQDSGSVSGEFTLSVPRSIASARAIELDDLYARVIVNGEETIRLDANTLSTVIEAPKGSTLNLWVMWYEQQDDRTSDLLLATWSDSLQVNGSVPIDLSSDSYDFGYGQPANSLPGGGGGTDPVNDGSQRATAEFDEDNDGFANLLERRESSNPYDSNETPLNRPDVRIGWVSPTDAPVIDGNYDTIWGLRAQFDDVNGDKLSIDNLMINQGAVRANGDAEMRWFAMHDDSNLYLFVLSENVNRATPMRDSVDVWDDDNVNLYIDGNNSKASSYDGVDDYNILIPFLTDPDNKTQNSTVVVKGSNSAPVPSFTFSACLCTAGQHTWEFKLPFSSFNIQKGVPFGIDIQIDLDHDGGVRDAKWGWAHPARNGVDVNTTWRNPSIMGTAVID